MLVIIYKNLKDINILLINLKMDIIYIVCVVLFCIVLPTVRFCAFNSVLFYFIFSSTLDSLHSPLLFC